jgi:hypothetical protein
LSISYKQPILLGGLPETIGYGMSAGIGDTPG